MIPRYTRPQMGAIWSDEHKYRTWLKVELAVCEAQADLGHLPEETLNEIRGKAKFDEERIAEIENVVKHDVIAFLTNVAEYVGPAARFIHLGMTSSDLLDSALALQMKDAGKILLEDISKLQQVLHRQALGHKTTVCIGRSHGVHAEPTSLGLKFALWYDEMARNKERLLRAIDAISTGKISGAVGTYSFLDPKVEEMTCQKLGLRPARISTQIIQRDVHAEFVMTLALIGSSVEKIALEIRHLQRTEVLEAEEPFASGQKGSSSMPHKRNPIGSENICGLARLLRSNSIAVLENIALWHERDISHSSVERVILPDSCILTDFILVRLTNILEKLVIYPENMLNNLRLTRGLIFSQAVLLALTKKGMSREEAYKIVQGHAMTCWQAKSDFLETIQSDARITDALTNEEIAACFDENAGLKHIDHIYEKVGLL